VHRRAARLPAPATARESWLHAAAAHETPRSAVERTGFGFCLCIAATAAVAAIAVAVMLMLGTAPQTLSRDSYDAFRLHRSAMRTCRRGARQRTSRRT